MAPSPYLDPLPKQKTLVIEPWEVLVALKGSTTYIRSYTDTFLKQIANYWNIVYWTDLMPDPVDDLLQKLPPGKVLYRYHCRFVSHSLHRKTTDTLSCYGDWGWISITL